jgi:hypothetical protein
MPLLPLLILNAVLYVHVSLASPSQWWKHFSVKFQINDSIFDTTGEL